MLYHIHCPLRPLKIAPPSYEALLESALQHLRYHDRDWTLWTDTMGINPKKYPRTLQLGATEERDL